MPYIIRKEGGKWKLKNANTGRVLGSHSSEAAARRQLRAIMANTNGKGH